MSYTFLLDAGEESSADCFSAIPRSALSRSIHSAASCCSNGNAMDSCQGSQSGTMFEPSTDARGGASATSSPEDSHARTFRPPPKPDQACAESEADSGASSEESRARSKRHISFSKTAPSRPRAALAKSSKSYPRWGMMQNGVCFRLAPQEQDTSASASFYLPTPTASWARRGFGISRNPRKMRYRAEIVAACLVITSAIGWRTGPAFCEMLTGWPIGWTGLEPLATAKFQRWWKMRGADFL